MIARFNKERLIAMMAGRHQKWVADQLGITRPLLNAYLMGTQPPLTNLLKIKNFFNEQTGQSLTTDDWITVENEQPAKKKKSADGSRNRRVAR